MKIQFGNPSDFTNPLNHGFYESDNKHEQKEHVVTNCERITCSCLGFVFIIIVIWVVVTEIRHVKKLKQKYGK